MNTTTESYHEHGGFKIRLRAHTGSGMGYAIFKEIPHENSPNGVKRIYLRKRVYNFVLPSDLLKEAKAHVDKHSAQLEQIFNTKIHANN